MIRPLFRADTDIAMKVPVALFDQMCDFYGDVLGLPLTLKGNSAKIEFGPCTLWLDKVATMTQPELWLKVSTSDTAKAASYLKERGVACCNEVEPLPDGFDGFWVSAPGGMIHLVAGQASPSSIA